MANSIPSVEKVESAFEKALGLKPENVLRQFSTQISKAINGGLSYKEVASIFKENFDIDAKPIEIKKIFEANQPKVANPANSHVSAEKK